MAFKNKAKGTRYENELYDLLVGGGYRCIRCAGSGTKEESNADIIAGKKGDGKYCIEAKSSKKPIKYITKEQVNNFIIFAEIFGLKPVIAVRFNQIGWYFLNPKDMKDSGKNWVVNLDIAKKKGKRFAQFFSEKNKKKEEKIELSIDNEKTSNESEIILQNSEIDELLCDCVES
jgi:Holliday junction resolvase